MDDVAIRVEALGKEYRIGARQKRHDTLRDQLSEALLAPMRRMTGRGGGAPKSDEPFRALKSVSFEVKHGEVLGVIGRNGAGKSTLLKILSRITEPTEGYAQIHGRVGSLLEVGTGFHQELTGRENVYLNGAILGMRRVEIDRKFDDIVAFAEIEKFIDTPVKHYSSGMYMRLAFAVAAHLETEILLIDEVLAVGDAEFQKRCLGKMGEIAREGRTVLFVSHNMEAIRNLCSEALLIDSGNLARQGPAQSVVGHYLSSAMQPAGDNRWRAEDFRRRRVELVDGQQDSTEGPFSAVALRLKEDDSKVVSSVRSDKGCWIEFEYELRRDVRDLRIGLELFTSDGGLLLKTFDVDDSGRYDRWRIRKAGAYVSRCHIPPHLLDGGRFIIGLDAGVFGASTFFAEEHALAFDVNAKNGLGNQWPEPRHGALRPALDWHIEHLCR